MASNKTNGLIKVKTPEEGLQIIQSHVLSTARYDFSVYEKRILYQLVLVAQRELSGRKIFRGKMSELCDQPPIDVEMRIADLLLGEEDKNHKRIKDASLSLMKKVVEYQDNEMWLAFHIINEAKIKKTAETLTVQVNPIIWEVILDFSRGFHAYELQCAMKFRSVYAMRFYELVSNPKYNGIELPPIPIDDIKRWFGLQEKYPNNGDFIKRVIGSAQKDLDDNAPWSFTFNTIKSGRKITHIVLKPVARPGNGSETLQQKVAERRVSISQAIPSREVRDYLRNTIEFSDTELRNTREIWKEASRNFGGDLIDIVRYKFNAESIQGKPMEEKKAYVVKSIKLMNRDIANVKATNADDFTKMINKLVNKFKGI